LGRIQDFGLAQHRQHDDARETTTAARPLQLAEKFVAGETEARRFLSKILLVLWIYGENVLPDLHPVCVSVHNFILADFVCANYFDVISLKFPLLDIDHPPASWRTQDDNDETLK
jgi:hypothetical protein